MVVPGAIIKPNNRIEWISQLMRNCGIDHFEQLVVLLQIRKHNQVGLVNDLDQHVFLGVQLEGVHFYLQELVLLIGWLCGGVVALLASAVDFVSFHSLEDHQVKVFLLD